MKNQRYGTTFKTSSLNNYFYDSGTGKVVMCSEEEIELIDKILNNEISLETARRRNDDFDKFVKQENLFKYPENVPFIIPTVEAIEENLKGQCTQIILELTEACNLRCGYCIYNKYHPDFREFGNRKMSFEVARKAIDLVLNDYKNENFALTFYGGEPLINFDLMKECIDYTKINYGYLDLTVSFTTNLTLLTKDMVNYFNDLYLNDNIKVSIMCSIDGPKDIHDRFRSFENGVGSFEKTIKGLNLLLNNFYKKDEEGKKITINCVISPPCNEEKITRIKDFFEKELQLPKDVTYNLGYAEGEVAFDYTKNKVVNVLNKVDKPSVNIISWVTDNIIKSNKNSMSLTDLNLLLNTIRGISHRRISNEGIVEKKYLHGNCIPGQRRLYVTVDGNFLPCERVGNCPSLGNYKDGIDAENIFKFYFKKYTEYYEEKCSFCWAQELCNICYVRNMGENGIEEESNLCEFTKKEIRTKFINYYELFENKNELLKDIVAQIIV